MGASSSAQDTLSDAVSNPPGKTLYLLRHAKSDWGDARVDDHERPLALRGERAASAIGAHLAATGVRPQRVLCSTARRAVDTLERVLAHFDDQPRVQTERELYLATPEQLLARLRREDEGVDSLLLVGHNPGIGELADWLAAPRESDERRRLARKYPTCAFTELHFDVCDWRDVAPATGELRRFVRPRSVT